MTTVLKTAGCEPTGVRFPHPAHTIQPYKHWMAPPSRIQSPVSQAGLLLANPAAAGRRSTRPPRERQSRSALPQPSGDRRAAWKDAPGRHRKAPRGPAAPPGIVPGDRPAPYRAADRRHRFPPPDPAAARHAPRPAAARNPDSRRRRSPPANGAATGRRRASANIGPQKGAADRRRRAPPDTAAPGRAPVGVPCSIAPGMLPRRRPTCFS